MKLRNFTKKQVVAIVAILTIIVLVVYFFVVNLRNERFMHGYDEPATALQAIYAEQEKSGKEQLSETNYLYSRIKEKDFVQFASSTIDVECPFYEPSGADYRTCLYDWAEKLSEKKTKSEIDTVGAYCEHFTARYEDVQELPGHELFAKCRIYKYSLKLPLSN